MSKIHFFLLIQLVCFTYQSEALANEMEGKESIEQYYDSIRLYFDDFHKAEFFSKKAISIATKINHQDSLGLVYMRLGSVYYRHEFFEKAIASFTTSLSHYFKSGNEEKVSGVLQYLGNCYYLLGNYQEALSFYQKGIDFNDSIQNKLKKAEFANYTGTCYDELMKIDKALELYMYAYEVFKQTDQKDFTANILVNIGMIYVDQLKFEKGLDCYKQAQDLYTELNDSVGISACLVNKGDANYMMGKYSEALGLFKRSLAIDEIIIDDYGIMINLNNIGDCLVKLGQKVEAEEYLNRGFEYATRLNNSHLRSVSLNNLSLLFLEAEEYPKSISFGERSLQIANEAQNANNSISALEVLYLAHEKQKDYKKAFEYSQQYHSLKDSLFTLQISLGAEKIQSEYEVGKHIQEKSKLEEGIDSLRNERVIIIGISVLAAFILFLLILYYRLKYRSSAKIKDQKEYFNLLMNHTEDFVAIVDRNANILYMSQPYEHKIGRTIADRINQSVFDFIHPDDLDFCRKLLKELNAGKPSVAFELRIVDNFGNWLYMSCNAKNLLNDPKINGILLNFWDITVKKNIEEKAIESEKSFKELFDNATDAIYILNAEGKFIDVNKGANRMYGYETREFVGKTPEFLSAKGKNDMEWVGEALKKAYNGEPQTIEFWGLRKNGEEFSKLVRMNPGHYFGEKVIVVFGTDISEIENTRKALKESNDKYKYIYNAFPDIFFMADGEGVILEISPSVERITGYTSEEIKGKSSRRFYRDVDWIRIGEKLKQYGSVSDSDTQLITRKGKILDCSINAQLIFDEDKNIVGVTGVIRDISERRKMELELVRSEEKYRSIFEAFPDVYYRSDMKGTLLEISPSVKKYMGYSREELIGKRAKDFYPGKWFSDDLITEIKDTGGLKDYNIQFIARYGEIIDCSIASKVLFDENGVAIEQEGVLRDITERRNMERKLIESENNFRRIFNAFPDVYFRVTNNGIVEEISPSCKLVSGFEREEIIGKSYTSLYSEISDLTTIKEEISEKGSTKDADVWLLTLDDRKLYCSLSLKLIYNEENISIGMEGVLRDITPRKKISLALEKSELELRKSNETKEKILSIIGHDLLGPIGTNKGMTDLIVNESESFTKEEIVDLVLTLKPSLDSTYNMVENLLAWARLQRNMITYNPELGYLKPIVDEIFSLFQVHAKSKEVFLNIKGEDTLSAYFDKNQITIVLRNLISNAIKFSPRNSEISVRLFKQENMAMVNVADQGIGIPESDIDHLFKEEGKSKPRYGTENEKGTGLGLVIVHEFILQHSGKISIKSKEGKGSVFTFGLPLNSDIG
jgi:PAS domain S-box-containing protein